MSVVLGVKIDDVTCTEAINRANLFLQNGQHTIFTPNPEMLVKAQKDEYFKKVLNSSDLNLCDGFGLWIATRIMNYELRVKNLIERIAGVDFMLDLCHLAAEEGRSVYLVGSGSEEVIKRTADNLQKQFPNLKIMGFDKGPAISENVELRMKNEESINNVTIEQLNNRTTLQINETYNARILAEINSKQPAILFVAFGMGKQERWIYENLAKLPSVKIAMGVGGAFDYISCKVPRAPRLMRKIGLEWMYRLFREPRRARRIFNATIKFCYLILIQKIYANR